MEKFEFKSQVATTKEQSERLLKLGLKKETADMYITNMSRRGINYTDDWLRDSPNLISGKDRFKKAMEV